MRRLTLLLPFALAFSLGFGPRQPVLPAPTAEFPVGTVTIHKTGIKDFDDVFREVRSVHTILDAAESRLDQLRDELAAQAGLPKGTRLDRTSYRIKAAGAGSIGMVLKGNVPMITIESGASDKAKSGGQKLNAAAEELARMQRDLGQMPAMVEKAVDNAKGFKKKLDQDLLKANGLPGSDLARVNDQLSHNTLLTDATPDRIQAVIDRTQKMLDAIPAGMTATSEPGAPVAVAVAVADPPPEKPVEKPVEKPPEKPPEKPVEDKPEIVQFAQASPIGEMIKEARASFDDAELDEAIAILSRADLALAQQSVPVPRYELEELFQFRALVNLVKGDAAGATWAVTQALVVHPNSMPIQAMGSEYAKLHKAIAKTKVVRQVNVRVSGEGRGYISGIEITQGSNVLLGQGQHLLQVLEEDGWKSSVVYVKDGFTVAL